MTASKVVARRGASLKAGTTIVKRRAKLVFLSPVFDASGLASIRTEPLRTEHFLSLHARVGNKPRPYCRQAGRGRCLLDGTWRRACAPFRSQRRPAIAG